MTDRSLQGRVVVGIGRSLGAYQALRYAVAEARRRRAVLVAVRAFWSTAYGQTLLPVDRFAEEAEARVDAAFAEACGGVPVDVALEVVVRDGPPARILVATANRDGDLIVIGGCGWRRLDRVRRMSVARFCAREAGCPVVVVPPNALARSAAADRLAREAADDAQEYLLRRSRCR